MSLVPSANSTSGLKRVGAWREETFMDTQHSYLPHPTRSLASSTRTPSRWIANLACAGCLSLGFVFATGALATTAATHAPLSVPNANFSDSANTGSVGGDLLGGSGSAVIGSGPWSGAYAGVLSVLAQPTLSIGGGDAQVSGLLGVDVGGILNNSGYFFQDTGTPWIANRRYTLTADIDAGGILDVNVLNSGNVGIALATGSTPATRVASSNAGGGVLTLLGGTSYRLSIEFVTGGTVSGNIWPQLYAEPSGLLTANLLGSVSFDNVVLTTHLLTQVPASLVPASPGPYNAVLGGVVVPAPSVLVLDALGDPIAGVSVNFSAPGSGASASIAPNPAVTDANGVAVVVATANSELGSYQIQATVSGVSPPLVFNVTNVLDPSIVPASVGTPDQNAAVATPFACALLVQIVDGVGTPLPNLVVRFEAPSSGPSAVLFDGVNSASSLDVLSNSNGFASVEATANGIEGVYDVTAQLLFSLNPPAVFRLRNLAANDPIMFDGFDGECVPIPGQPAVVQLVQ